MRVLDLFSGIGAFSLGLERAGMRTVAFVEIDPFCRRVLAKHWPEVRCYDDVQMLTADRLVADNISVDIICGGFPCQDISVAGRGAGLAGERSGLWSEFARLIGEIRPSYAIVENVAALLGRGLGTVLGDLAALGYDAEWHCIPASAIGAPHIRDRVWVVAYAECAEWRSQRRACDGLVVGSDSLPQRQEGAGGPAGGGEDGALANSDSGGWRRARGRCRRSGCDTRAGQFGDGCEVCDPISVRPQGAIGGELLGLSAWGLQQARGSDQWWATEPDVGRVVDGAASRVDRRKRLIGLGNSLVPQIPELIGRAILAASAAELAA